ncbi:unnamed protein product [Urochloa humidicola]
MLPSSRPSTAGAAFAEQQLKQLRAQCLVFLAFRNNLQPRKKHLEIALGECPAEGSSSGSSKGDRREANNDESHGQTGWSWSSPVSVSSAAAGLPPPDLEALSSLRLSSAPGGRTRRVIRRGPRRVGEMQ